MANRRQAFREKLDISRDWLTALSPLVLIMMVNYPWSAVLRVLVAAGGHLAVTFLWRVVKATYFHPVPSLVCGVLMACCLPSTVPLWVALVGGCIGGAIEGALAWCNRTFEWKELACPVYLPPFVGFLTVRWLFAAQWSRFVMPALWMPSDTTAGATPLAAVRAGGVDAINAQRLFWGLEPGSMGHGPILALVLGCAYLLLRRRLRSWAPLTMLAVTAIAAGLRWGQPVYGWLLGGTVLAALLLADGDVTCLGWKGQLVLGFVAGMVTVCCLSWGADGSAAGVLLACVLVPFLRLLYHKCWAWMPFVKEKFRKSENKG